MWFRAHATAWSILMIGLSLLPFLVFAPDAVPVLRLNPGDVPVAALAPALLASAVVGFALGGLVDYERLARRSMLACRVTFFASIVGLVSLFTYWLHGSSVASSSVRNTVGFMGMAVVGHQLKGQAVGLAIAPMVAVTTAVLASSVSAPGWPLASPSDLRAGLIAIAFAGLGLFSLILSDRLHGVTARKIHSD